MKRRLAFSVLLIVTLVVVGLATDRPAAQTAAAESGPEVTVYNSNIALVKETRSLDLKKGVNAVRIVDVPAQIDPTSVHFASLTDPTGTVVLEQNFEYDLVNTLKVLEKYVDREVRLMTQDGTIYVGTLLSARGDIILAAEDGSITIVKQDQVQKFDLAELPEGLITRPTLAWLVQAEKEGPQDIELAYLTGGMNWHANYVLLLAQDEKSMDLNGWVTLDNRSGGTFRDAKLKLVAGEIARAAQPERMMVEKAPKAAPLPTPQVEERGFFEYHLYEVQRPVTIRDNQTKQIEFISAANVPATKRFIFNASRFNFYGDVITDPTYGSKTQGNPDVYLEFRTGKESGLNVPLPAGVVRMYKEDVDGAPLLIGEANIGHTPVDETVRLRVGKAFDIVGERLQTDFTKLGSRALEESYRITLRNHKKEDVSITVVEHLFRAAEWTITKASHDYTKVDANTVHFDVTVPASGEVEITYTVRYRW